MTATELNLLTDSIRILCNLIRADINYVNNVKRAFSDDNIYKSEEIEFSFRIQRR